MDIRLSSIYIYICVCVYVRNVERMEKGLSVFMTVIAFGSATDPSFLMYCVYLVSVYIQRHVKCEQRDF